MSASDLYTPPEDPTATRVQRLVARAMAAMIWVIAFLPARIAYLLADLAAPILVWVTRIRERRIGKLGRGLLRNQRIVFRDELTPRRSRELLWAWARHMTNLVVDFCRMRRIHAGTLADRVDLAALATLRQLHAEGNGVICVGGHLGVFELAGHAAALSGLPAVEAFRPADNVAISEVLNQHRTASGLEVVGKWGVIWSFRKALARGALIGLAADENARVANPLFVPFLGTLAATHTSAAQLQRRSGAPIAVVSCHRVRRGRYRLHVWDVIRNPKTRDPDPERVERVTRRINDALSKAILTYPEQWFWGSRRFQTRPPGEVPGPDGLPPRATARRSGTNPAPTGGS